MFSGSALSDTKVDVDKAADLVRSLCLVGDGYEMSIQGDGNISIFKKGIEGSLSYSTSDLEGVVDVPDKDKVTELENIRNCTKPYIPRLLEAILGAYENKSKSNASEGWYFSDINKSCTEECSKYDGLVCNTKSVVEMKRINSSSAFEKMNASGPNVGCSTYGDDTHPITPFKINGGGYDQCEWRRRYNRMLCTESEGLSGI